jgi:hypothetical protein
MLKKLPNPHAGFLRIDDTAKVSKSTKPNIGASRALLLSSDKHTIRGIFVSRKASHETVAHQLQKPSPQALPANARCDRGCDGDDC